MRFTNGTTVRMPHQFGLLQASATAIQTMIAITILTRGTRKSRIHHSGFLATFNIRTMFAIGIQASQLFSVLVLVAMVYSAKAK